MPDSVEGSFDIQEKQGGVHLLVKDCKGVRSHPCRQKGGVCPVRKPKLLIRHNPQIFLHFVDSRQDKSFSVFAKSVQERN